MSDVTRLLTAVGQGDRQAGADLLPLIYQELKRLAQLHMSQERREHTLQATALVHEAYLRLVDGGQTHWDGRRHFFAAAAEAMRRILIEHARRKNAWKHGGQHQRVELDEDLPIALPCRDAAELLALDEALECLSREDPERAELVKLIFFAGLNLQEAAETLGISRTTVYQRWVFTRAWLFEAVNGAAKP